uniref:OSJNBa0065H10.4 protein n=1 Tax=Oryza sativa subsp. japonica TaxID=39947 RepID=Q7X7Z1_ORYSJ|nr:OSJNBa0079A21.19 [Oryza sativa Japonica Group]CAE05132.1 OSJNBa0065H10.4 [Oryza sativa Japonica Group]
MVDFLIGLLRVPAGLAARVLTRHGVAKLYAGARALDGAFFLVSPGPDRRLPPTPSLRLLRPRVAARCRSPSAATLSRRFPPPRPRARPLTLPLRLLQPPPPTATDALASCLGRGAHRRPT